MHTWTLDTSVSFRDNRQICARMGMYIERTNTAAIHIQVESRLSQVDTYDMRTSRYRDAAERQLIHIYSLHDEYALRVLFPI